MKLKVGLIVVIIGVLTTLYFIQPETTVFVEEQVSTPEIVENDPFINLSCADDLNKLLAYKTLSFSDYPAETLYEGPIAELDQDSEETAKRFYSRYQSGIEEGVRYNGKYVVAEWAMTGSGHSLGIMDAETGKVVRVPTTARLGFEYRPDSSLLIADSLSITRAFAEENMDTINEDNICTYFDEPGYSPEPKYYTLENGSFVEISN